jgi:hypothetical protein
MAAAPREQSFAWAVARRLVLSEGVKGAKRCPPLLKRSASSFRSVVVDMRPNRGLDFSSVHVMISPHLAVGSDASLVYPRRRCEK